MSQITCPANLDHLADLLLLVSSLAKKMGFAEERIQEIELAAEEALVNIFNYSYPDGSGDVEVKCRTGSGTSMIVEIQDGGIPFNLLSIKEPDLTADISERKIGGLGIFLIKRMANEVRYQRRDDRNILTLVFMEQAPTIAAPSGRHE
ncbi:MAG: ATP-binding protein [Pseudomonadota bacterium]